MASADISGRAEAALEAFSKEPFVYALRPVVKGVLQSIASSKLSEPQVNPHDPQADTLYSVMPYAHRLLQSRGHLQWL